MQLSLHGSDGYFLDSHLKEKGNGLCPSLLSEDYSSSKDAKTAGMESPMTKSYETSSQYLNASVRDARDTSLEVEFLCEAITNCLDELIDDEGQSTAIISIGFEVAGCIWTLHLNPSLNLSAFEIKVVCLARAAPGKNTTYLIDTHWYNKEKQSVALRSELTAEALSIFDAAAYMVQKAVAKCELPRFPAGGKGIPFKEIYKLNKKVSILSRLYSFECQ